MRKMLPFAVAVAAVVFSTASRAEECTPNNLSSTCAPMQIAAQPQPTMPPFVPMQPAPDRYPGPALQSANGGADGAGGGGGGDQ